VKLQGRVLPGSKHISPRRKSSRKKEKDGSGGTGNFRGLRIGSQIEWRCKGQWELGRTRPKTEGFEHSRKRISPRRERNPKRGGLNFFVRQRGGGEVRELMENSSASEKALNWGLHHPKNGRKRKRTKEETTKPVFREKIGTENKILKKKEKRPDPVYDYVGWKGQITWTTTQ